jgi:hypothetical protein
LLRLISKEETHRETGFNDDKIAAILFLLIKNDMQVRN